MRAGKPVQKKTVKSRCGAQSLCADTCRLMLPPIESILRKRGIHHVGMIVPTRCDFREGGKSVAGMAE